MRCLWVVSPERTVRTVRTVRTARDKMTEREAGLDSPHLSSQQVNTNLLSQPGN